jgi:hypothetical protein
MISEGAWKGEIDMETKIVIIMAGLLFVKGIFIGYLKAGERCQRLHIIVMLRETVLPRNTGIG